MKPRMIDVTLEDLYLSELLDTYELSPHETDTVATAIFRYLTSHPGVIRHKRSATMDEETAEGYIFSLQRAVSKGAPIDVFITAFAPKFRHLSNHQIYPDMCDLLTFVHLQLIAKSIRDLYPYGFRFLIGYKGRVYEPLGCWGEEAIAQTFAYLNELNRIAEGITGVRNAVHLYDIADLIGTMEEEYSGLLTSEIDVVRCSYEGGDPVTVKKVDAWARDFRGYIDESDFKGINLDAHLLQEAITYRAYKNIRFKGGEKGLGICSPFPHVLQVNTKGNEATMSLQLNPYFRYQSYQRLITLQGTEWVTVTWEEMEEGEYEPVYFEEFPYPFYYKKR